MSYCPARGWSEPSQYERLRNCSTNCLVHVFIYYPKYLHPVNIVSCWGVSSLNPHTWLIWMGNPLHFHSIITYKYNKYNKYLNSSGDSATQFPIFKFKFKSPQIFFSTRRKKKFKKNPRHSEISSTNHPKLWWPSLKSKPPYQCQILEGPVLTVLKFNNKTLE